MKHWYGLVALLTLAACDPAKDTSAETEPWACGDSFTPEGPDFALPASWAPEAGEFIVVVIPDTQIYAQSFPETFDSQLRWIATWAETYNIVFVTHVGDIVQSGEATDQWEVATAAYDWLEDKDIPHGFSIGNHDFGGSWGDDRSAGCGSNFGHLDCEMRDYLNYFGPEKYQDRPWYGGHSPSGHSDYQQINAGGLDLIFLHMPQDPRRAEVDWAKSVLDAHPDSLVHLTTHRYLFDYRLTSWLPEPLNLVTSGRFNALTYTLGGQSVMFEDSLTSDELYTELSAYPNVWGVHCGHVDAEFKQQSLNSAGLPIHEILVDYQDMSDGGGGWLRLLKFKPTENQIDVISFSTLTGQIRQNGDGFEHSLYILNSYKDLAFSELAGFGFDVTAAEALLAKTQDPDAPERQEYFDSLYGAGDRDSCFSLEVDFSAYTEAAQ